jgi:hypothetical protein
VFDQDIFGRGLRRPLETDRVIPGTDIAMPDNDIAATVDIYAVVVEIGLILNRHMFDQKVIAIEIVLHPARRVLQRNPVDMDAPAIDHADNERSSGCAMNALLAMKAGPASVDYALAADRDIFATFGEDQRLVHTHIGVLNRAALRHPFRVILQVERPQKARAFPHLQPDMATQSKCAADIVTAHQPDRATAIRRRINGFLDKGCGQTFARITELLRRHDTFWTVPWFQDRGQALRHRFQISPQRRNPVRECASRRLSVTDMSCQPQSGDTGGHLAT